MKPGSILLICFAMRLLSPAQAQVKYSYDANGNLAVRALEDALPPQIIGQPQLQIVAPDELASFIVVLADTRGANYQWRFNGTDIPSATADTLFLGNVSASNEGSYSVVITNISGSVTSAPAMLWIDSDRDGLPDSWELSYFGNLTSQRGGGDADSDGVSNLNEFLQGTNPTNSALRNLRLTILTDGGGSVAAVPTKLSYNSGETVTLTATPYPPNSFHAWTGDTNTQSNPIALLMDTNKTVQARFISAAPPPGMVAWWRAESNALDTVGTNNGVLINGATFSTGKVGLAFSMDGVSQSVEIADAPALHPASLTIEGWVQFSAADGVRVFFAKPLGSGPLDSFTVWLDNGNLRAVMSDASGFGPFLGIPFSPAIGRWYHIAFTFDDATKQESLYLDAVRVASANAGRSIGYDSHPVLLGREIENGSSNFFFAGNIDEAAFYNRALTTAEIASIYVADVVGKNPAQPTITSPSQFPDATAGIGYTQQVTTVLGTPPISFSVSGGGLPAGLTLSSTGIISGIPASAGSNTFAVVAMDAAGLSSAELVCGLNVTPALVPATPGGLVAWWRAENNAQDYISTHDGALSNGVTYAVGKVGQAFSFDGSDDYFIASDAGLPSGNAPRTVEFWMRYETGASGNHPPFVYGGQSAPSSFYVIVVGNRLYIGNFGGGDTPGSTTATDGDWHHIALTHDGSTTRMYVDGQLDAAVNRTYATVLSGGFYMGAALGPFPDRFKGQVDELAVYDRALSQPEIAAIYNAGVAGKKTSGPYIDAPPVLPDGIVGQNYSQTFSSILATAPVSYLVTAGTLPSGLALSSGGVLSGTLSDAGSYNFVVRATDGTSSTGEQLFTVQVFAPIPPASGLVAWWRAENNTQDQIGIHHGALSNGVTFAVGKVGQAFSFDGSDDYFVAPDTGLPSGNAARTVEFWMKYEPGASGNQIPVAYGGVSASSTFYVVMIGNRLYIGRIGGGDTPGSTIATDGNWHHVALTHDGFMTRMYVDGQLDATVSRSYSTLLNGSFYMGAVPGTPDRFRGQVDELAVYDVALSQIEIAAIFSAGASGKKTSGPYINTPAVLPDAVVGQNYSQTLTSIFATPPVSYLVVTGSPPPGLALSSAGVLSGTPTTSGSLSFTVRATDAAGLATDQTFTLQVWPRVSPPAGMVGWWRAENNALDSAGSNDGFLVNGTSFGAGKVGQAFSFDGLDDAVEIEDAPSLRPASVTLEAWVMFLFSGGVQHVFAKAVGDGGADSYVLWLENGNLRGMICDVGGGNNFLSVPFSPVQGRWYHVAFTFDEITKQQLLYLDGSTVATSASYRSIGYDAHPLLLGADIENGNQSLLLQGRIDEAAIYNRALSAGEIALIYNAGAAGKTTVGPYLDTPPLLPDGGVGQGYTQALSSVRGTMPVSYSLVGGALPSGISLNSAGVLSGIPANEGAFHFVVRVTDAAGSFGDQAFTLQIDAPVDAPAGIVSLWRAENNAVDSVGANHGFLTNGASFALGQVGSAFSLDGVNDYIQIADSPSLRPASITLEGWFLFSAANGIRVLCAKPLGPGFLDSYGIWLENGVLKAAVCDTGGFGPILSYPFSPALGWYHIAYTFDDASKEQVLYVDRVTVAIGVADRSIAYDAKPLLLGADIENGNRAYFFSGRIDEVSLYNRALTAAEITSVYNAGPGGKSLVPTLPPLILRPSLQGGVLMISFDARIGKTYTVQSVPALTTSAWPDLTNITAVSTNVVFSDFITNPQQRFYRVKTAGN